MLLNNKNANFQRRPKTRQIAISFFASRWQWVADLLLLAIQRENYFTEIERKCRSVIWVLLTIVVFLLRMLMQTDLMIFQKK